MRPIKFRAWSKKEKVMTMCWDLHHIPVAILTDRLDCELMQFTGLIDQNGREIYEGDICRFTDKRVAEEPSMVKAIEWYDGSGFLVDLCDLDEEEDYEPLGLLPRWAIEIEVIGNIHENPYLLK